MKSKLQIFNHRFLYLLIVISISACSPSPADFGEKVARKEYECRIISSNDDLIQKKKLWETIQSKEFKTQREFSEFRTLFIETMRQESKSKTCYDEVRKMREDAELTFPDQNDRTTWRNSYNAHSQKLAKDFNEETKEIKAKTMDIDNKLSAISQKLPWF